MLKLKKIALIGASALAVSAASTVTAQAQPWRDYGHPAYNTGRLTTSYVDSLDWKITNAARNGVFAALLAAEGLTGPAPIFEGDLGIMKLLDRINRTGTTVLMATHDQAIVDQMRKRVIELETGRMVRDQSRGVYGYSA